MVYLVSGVSQLQLGPVPLPIWLIFVVLAVTRQVLNLEKLERNGRSTMKTISKMINVVSFTLTGFAEMVWDIGTKVAAAS
jgi:hypothetical protein